MAKFLPESDPNLSRRAVLHGAFLSCASGCSSSISPYLTYTKSRPHSIRLVTPWDKSLQTNWTKDFTNWILASNQATVNVSWLVVSENELSRTPPERLAQISDGLLGGHHAIHRKFQSFPVTTQALKPVRVPIVSKFPDSSRGRSKANTLSTSTNLSWSNTGDPNLWPVIDQFLKLPDPQTDLLSQAYTSSVFRSAPDQATGFARWIRLARQVHPMQAPDTDKSSIVSLDSITKQNLEIWKGGTGLTTALGMSEAGPIYWPECLSLWKSPQPPSSQTDTFQEFCRKSNRLTGVLNPDESTTRAHASTNDLASIILFECRSDIQTAWGTIENSTGEIRQRAEKYLTELPPWPPASIQDLQKRRGFEYVVALVEQMASDGDERDWLIREFQNQETKVNLEVLDQALNGHLQGSIRFRTWLRAEWTAWIRQRCRRVTRYLTEL